MVVDTVTKNSMWRAFALNQSLDLAEPFDASERTQSLLHFNPNLMRGDTELLEKVAQINARIDPVVESLFGYQLIAL